MTTKKEIKDKTKKIMELIKEIRKDKEVMKQLNKWIKEESK